MVQTSTAMPAIGARELTGEGSRTPYKEKEWKGIEGNGMEGKGEVSVVIIIHNSRS